MTNLLDARTSSLLRSLDPAHTPADLAAGSDERAQRTLTRILGTDPTAGTGHPATSDAPHRTRRLRRLVSVGAAVAVGVAAAVVGPSLVPGMTGGGRAYAAWTASPDTVSARLAAQAEDRCTDDGWFGLRPAATPAGLKAVITDVRGPWALVYLTDGKPDPRTRMCLVENGDVVGTIGADPGPRSAPEPALAPDSARGPLGGLMSDQNRSLRMVTGRVGSDVVGLELATEAKGTVTATVQGGYFAAWWPDAPTTEEQENADVTPAVTGATVILRDGTRRPLPLAELTGMPEDLLSPPDQGGSAG